MKTKVMEVITYKKQTSKTKYIIEAALEYRPPLNISRNFSSEKKAAASVQENTVGYLKFEKGNQSSISSVIRQNGESQNEGNKKTKNAKFSKEWTFLTSWYAHVRTRIRG